MKQKEFKEIELDILNKPSDNTTSKPLAKSMIIVSSVYLAISLVLFIVSLFLVKKVNLLSIIPTGFFYSVIILFIIYMIASIILAVFFKKFKAVIILIYYKVYDMLSFILMLICGLSFLVMFLVTPTTVAGSSMNNTLTSGDKVLIWHMGYEPKRDDIVVVHVSKKYGLDDSLYIKRVVAKEGDIVSWDAGVMYVNGNFLEEVNLYQFQHCVKKYKDEAGVEESYKIPKGYSIVMGDHRTSSQDSREIGLIDNDDIIGKAIYSLIPFKKISKKSLSYS